MKLPTTLYNSFNQGRDKLEFSCALLNPYAKWMQSPNIPKNSCLPIALTSIESENFHDSTVDQWFKQLNTNLLNQLQIPTHFPTNYNDSKYYSLLKKGNHRWMHAILSCNDNLFELYSEQSKERGITDFITNATNLFFDIYNVNIFRVYREKKAEIYSSLFKNTSSAGLHIFSIIINKNILVMHEFGYELCCNYDKSKKSICLYSIPNSDNVGCVINNDENGNIDITPILSTRVDLYESRTNKIKIMSNENTLIKYKSLNKQKLSDIRNESQENGLSIYNDEKKLSKDELIAQLLNNF